MLLGDLSKKEKGSIYMVFPYMDHDLAGLLDNPKVRLTQPQIKTYLKQLLEGTAYLHHVSKFSVNLIALQLTFIYIYLFWVNRTEFFIVI